MGFFNNDSVLTNSAKIAQTISDCSSEIINYLLLEDIPIKTHDSLKIIVTIMSNYCFTVVYVNYADKSKDYKKELEEAKIRVEDTLDLVDTRNKEIKILVKEFKSNKRKYLVDTNLKEFTKNLNTLKKINFEKYKIWGLTLAFTINFLDLLDIKFDYDL